MATNEMADAANDLLGLPSRLRIVTIFALWWEELDRVLYTDTNQASRCLHHISRILEDATYVGDKRGDGEMLEDDEDEDDLEMLSARLVKIVIQEFGDIAESCFRHMQTATDMLFLRAGTRFLISYKQACWKTFDDFYIIFPSDQLEMFLTERAMTDDVLLASRLAFLAGELIEETDAQSPVAPTDILDMIIRRFKEAKQALQERIPDLIEFVKRLPSKAYYIKDSSIPIPVPEDASSASVEWDTDDANVSDSVEFLLTKAIGNLRLLAAIADYTEVLHPCVEASIVESCLQLLSFPHFTIQIYALGWFSTALIHKKIATDFVDMNGISIVMEFTKENKDVENRLQLLAPYVSYIMVALSKHGPAIQSLVTDETFANKFIQFGLSFLADTGVDTQLNIIEWLGECFNHPCLLRTIHQVNVLPILTKAMHRALSSDSEDNMASMQLQLRREIMKSMLKFIAVNLFWAVQYSKSISVDALTSSDNNNVMNSILSSPSKKFFSTLASSSSTNSLNKDASAATASASLPGGINGPHILGSYSGITKVSDDDLTELEMYALQMLMKNDQLPVGMCSNLFGIMDPYQQDEEAVGDVLGAVGGMGSMEDDNMSLASQVKKVFPEWTIAKLFMKFKVIPVLLQTIIVEVKDTITLCTALYILELLCLDAAAIVEIQQTIPNKSLPNNEEEAAQDDANPLEGKKGLEILLATISNPSRKDPAVISATLKTLSAMCTPPHFRYKGSSVQVAKSLFEDMMFSNGGAGIGATAANTANNSKRRLDTSTKKHYVIHRDLTTNLEQVQSTIRTSIRSYSGINSLMQLIYYRKNQLFAITVRLETVRVLLGMAQDAEIKLILSKMRIPAIVENQVRAETNQLNYLEVNANVSGKSSEKALLELYCDILSSQLSNYTPGSSNMALMERNLDATQDALERKAIVDHSRVSNSIVLLCYFDLFLD